jgi:hypothetical protein
MFEGKLFERFTDRARRVVVLAQEEARLLNHNYIDTEHLLLGLIHEGEGVAATALESLAMSLEAVRGQVEEIIGQGQSAPTGHIPFTPGPRRCWSCRCGRPSSWATTTSAPSTSCSGSSVRARAWPPRCWSSWAPAWTGVRQQVIHVLSGSAAAGMEAGARTRLVRMTVPEELRQAEEQLAQVRREKEAAIDAEDFERAAGLRDKERQLLGRLAEQERTWTAGVDLEAVVQENHNLHREVERLRELLRQHGIEPDGGTTQTA